MSLVTHPSEQFPEGIIAQLGARVLRRDEQPQPDDVSLLYVGGRIDREFLHLHPEDFAKTGLAVREWHRNSTACVAVSSKLQPGTKIPDRPVQVPPLADEPLTTYDSTEGVRMRKWLDRD